MQKNDILWKSILEDVFEDFLTFFYPESAQIFDFAIESKLKGDEFTLQFKKELYYEFKNRNIPSKKKLAIALFLQNYVNFDNQEYVIKYNNEIKYTKNKTMGIEEFIKQQIKEEAKLEGKEEERVNMAKKLKDAGVDINVISNVTGLSVEVINNL